MSDDRKVTHVAKLRTEKDVSMIKRYLREAYEFSVELVEPPTKRT